MEAAHKQSDGWRDGEIKSSDMHKVPQMEGGKGKRMKQRGEKLKRGENGGRGEFSA